MLESKAMVGLSWEPKLPNLSVQISSGSSSSTNPQTNKFENNVLWRPNIELVDGLFVAPNDPRKLNKLLRKQVKDTTGKSWYDMPASTMPQELQRDLQVLKLRDVIDPTRHYKKGDLKNTKYFQVGTVIEHASDFYSERLTKKERKPTFAEEILSDRTIQNYSKRKLREIQEENRPSGNEKWKIKGKKRYNRSKRRRH